MQCFQCPCCAAAEPGVTPAVVDIAAARRARPGTPFCARLEATVTSPAVLPWLLPPGLRGQKPVEEDSFLSFNYTLCEGPQAELRELPSVSCSFPVFCSTETSDPIPRGAASRDE